MDEFDRLARQSIDGLLEPLGLDPKRDRTKAYEILAVQMRRAFKPRQQIVEEATTLWLANERLEITIAKLRKGEVA